MVMVMVLCVLFKLFWELVWLNLVLLLLMRC